MISDRAYEEASSTLFAIASFLSWKPLSNLLWPCDKTKKIFANEPQILYSFQWQTYQGTYPNDRFYDLKNCYLFTFTF